MAKSTIKKAYILITCANNDRTVIEEIENDNSCSVYLSIEDALGDVDVDDNFKIIEVDLSTAIGYEYSSESRENLKNNLKLITVK